MDLFNIVFGILVVTIVGFIVYTIRKAMADVRKGLGPAPSERTMKRALEEMRKRDVRCPRCREQATMMLGTGNGYKCDSCNHEFEDVKHFQTDTGRSSS